MLAAVGSMFTLVVLSTDRFTAVFSPINRRKWFGKKRVGFFILCVFLMSLVPFGIAIYSTEVIHGSCTWSRIFEVMKAVDNYGYCVVPCTLVVILNFLTIVKVCRGGVKVGGGFEGRERKRKRNLTVTLLVVSFVSVVCCVSWIIAYNNLAWFFFIEDTSSEAYATANVAYYIVTALAVNNHGVNFLIYVSCNRHFRRELCRMFSHSQEGSSTVGSNAIQMLESSKKGTLAVSSGQHQFISQSFEVDRGTVL